MYSVCVCVADFQQLVAHTGCTWAQRHARLTLFSLTYSGSRAAVRDSSLLLKLPETWSTRIPHTRHAWPTPLTKHASIPNLNPSSTHKSQAMCGPSTGMPWWRHIYARDRTMCLGSVTMLTTTDYVCLHGNKWISHLAFTFFSPYSSQVEGIQRTTSSCCSLARGLSVVDVSS